MNAPQRFCLFDLDGALVDSAPSILASFAAVLTESGLSPVVPLEAGLIGPPLVPTLQRITGIDDPVRLQGLAEGFKSHYDTAGYRETVVYPGIEAMLQALIEAGIGLVIVTNKRIAPTRKILEHLGWTARFAGVYAQDAFSPGLPSKTAVMAEAMRRHGVNRAEAVYVGDRAEDGEAARANCLRFLWAQWGYGVELDLGDYPGGIALPTPAAVPAIFQAITKQSQFTL